MGRNKFVNCFFLLLLTACLLLACGKAPEQTQPPAEAPSPSSSIVEEPVQAALPAASPLDLLEVTLPEGVQLQRTTDTQEAFVSADGVIGGVFLLDVSASVLDDVLGRFDALQPIVIEAMGNYVQSDMEWQMASSSLYALYEYGMGNGSTEYIAYFLRGETTCYVLWFDRNQVSLETEAAIMQSIHSDDITEKLNRETTDDIMSAINKSKEGKNFRFKVTLPNDMSLEETAEDGALYYQNGNVVGGYQVVHFEKGILPDVPGNKELILQRLKDSTKYQIDLTDFNGDITSETPITAVFTNGDQEYTHYILYYGQIGTQYDLWFDTKQLNTQTTDSILSTATVEELPN